MSYAWFYGVFCCEIVILIDGSGDKQETRGTAFVVYEDIYDAKNAVDHLSGFNVCGRYLVVLYYQATKMQTKIDNQQKKKEIDDLKFVNIFACFGNTMNDLANSPFLYRSKFGIGEVE